MIDIQIYNGDKKIRHKSNVWWYEAKSWLLETQEKLIDKKFTSIEIQVYSSQNMPVDSGEFSNFENSIQFLNYVLNNSLQGKYPNIYASNTK